MADKEPKVTRILIEYDDGSVKEALGDDAQAIMEHWDSLEFHWFNHGFRYNGPTLKRKEPEHAK